MYAKFACFALSLVFMACCYSSAVAQKYDHSPRQYYSDWKKHSSGQYHYRNYYYKPKKDYHGYKHHVVIHHPKKPKHCYYYNPYEKKYWGRCPTDCGGKPLYSLLKPEHRKGTLAQISEDHFPVPTSLPPIPESEDGVLLDLPPDDLPDDIIGDFR